MALLVAFVVAVVATPLVAAAANRFGIVDRPGPLKTHTQPVAYLGGVAVFAGLLVGVVASGRFLLVVPLLLALAIGLADDLRPVPAGARLVAECVLAVVAAIVVPGDDVTRIATAGLVVVLVNAVNLLDGQDGLAASVGIAAALGFAAFGGDATGYGLGLAGALGGFLVFNRPPARIYLGDAGSYLLGTALALAPSLAVGDAGPWPVLFATPLVVAIPLADTAIAVARRLRSGRPLFTGDRSHVYDQLVDRGWTVRGSTVVMAFAQILFSAYGVFALQFDSAGALTCTLLGAVVAVVVAVRGDFVVAVGDPGEGDDPA